MEKNTMILGQDVSFSLDCRQTRLNNNVLVVGTSGAGKTRSIVTPNLLQASGSYVISDPKGTLYKKYKAYLEGKGYTVKKLDFTDPKNSSHYNFFEYIKSTQDIMKTAHILTYSSEMSGTNEMFWQESTQLLLQAVMALLIEQDNKKLQNLRYMMDLISRCQINENDSSSATQLDLLMKAMKNKNTDSYAAKTYEKFRIAAGRTLKSILISAFATLGNYDTPEINAMTEYDDIDIPSLGKQKTAIFVIVSDTERSMDGLVNIFYTQTMNELCRYADKECEDGCLPIPVRFIMDDFATNCKIEEFPRMISSIRSRGISTMLMIQAESQLAKCYGYDGKTIIGNCDTYVYMGGNDIETAASVAERCDVPMKKILYMPVGTVWIFRRGQNPIQTLNFDIDTYLAEKGLNENKVTEIVCENSILEEEPR